MKFICCLLFSCFIIASLHGQNCKILDNQSFFKSIKFGKPFPSKRAARLNAHVYHLPSSTDYFLESDSLSQRCKRRNRDIFSFLSTPFNFLKITANKRGQIFYISLRSFFNDNRIDDSTRYEPPRNFTDIYNKLVSLYGKPTKTEFGIDIDSLFIRERGMPRLAEWRCNDILLQLSVRYGALDKNLNMLMIQITSRQFEIFETLKEAE